MRTVYRACLNIVNIIGKEYLYGIDVYCKMEKLRDKKFYHFDESAEWDKDNLLRLTCKRVNTHIDLIKEACLVKGFSAYKDEAINKRGQLSRELIERDINRYLNRRTVHTNMSTRIRKTFRTDFGTKITVRTKYFNDNIKPITRIIIDYDSIPQLFNSINFIKEQLEWTLD